MRQILYFVGKKINFTQHKEECMSTGNKEDDKQTEAFLEAEESIEGTSLFWFPSTNYETEPEGRVENVDGRGDK